MERFVLIDGNAILYRAFHALPPLTSSKGEVVNAVYGFFSMFLKIVADIEPACIVVCFDRPKPTFRQQLYVGYQAQRPKMDGDLVPQIVLVHEILEKAGVKIFEVDGYEADDLIGTLAKQVIDFQKTQNTQKTRESTGSDNQSVRNSDISDSLTNRPTEFSECSENIEVIIVSGDRDLLQLVNAHVRVLAPIVGLTNTVLFDEQKVEEKFGIKPSQIIDYKALVGDASDNYPGVTGIGPKTASSLLKQYETLENLYEHIKDLPAKIGERLATDAEQAALAKKLATITIDCPITLDLESCSLKHFDMKALGQAFEELGFKSLVKRLLVEEVEETASNAADAKGQRKKGDKGKERRDNEQLGLI